MAQIIIDLSGKNGLVHNFFNDKDKSSSTPNRRFLARDGEMADGVYNPFTRYGYMSPSNTGLASVPEASSTYAGLMKTVQFDEDNEDFYVSVDTQIWSGSNRDDLILDLERTPTNTNISDMEIYQINGVKKLFYSYNKSANISDIGIATLPFATPDDTWLSATTGGDQFTLSNIEYHKMIVADNGFMYVLDGSSVHKIDGTTAGGTNGTTTANVLVFPPYLNTYDAIDTRGKLYIIVQDVSNPLGDIASGTTRGFSSVQAGVYIWDRQSTTVNFTDFIPVEGVNFIQKIYISAEGKIRIMVTAADGTFQIRQFTGSTFKTIQEAGEFARPNFRDSVYVGEKYISWFGNDGFMYAYGRVSPNDKEGIFKYGDIASAATNLTSGAILYAGDASEGFYTGFSGNSVVQIKKWFPHAGSAPGGHNQGADKGDIFTPVYPLPVLSTVQSIRIYCLPSENTASTVMATLKFYFNQSATSAFSKSIKQSDIKKGYIDIEINKSFVTTVQMEIEFNTNELVGTDDFAPYLATIEYEASDAAKSNPS